MKKPGWKIALSELGKAIESTTSIITEGIESLSNEVNTSLDNFNNKFEYVEPRLKPLEEKYEQKMMQYYRLANIEWTDYNDDPDKSNKYVPQKYSNETPEENAARNVEMEQLSKEMKKLKNEITDTRVKLKEEYDNLFKSDV